MLSLLVMGVALAADPWGRPDHLRAVAEAPESLDERAAPRRVRLWWDDEPGVRWEIAMEGTRGWLVVDDDGAPGWTSSVVPQGTRFRVRRVDGARWSPALAADPWWSPEQLARMAGPADAALARTVGQVVVSEEDGVLWASTLGGGLLGIDPDGQVKHLGPWEGLPSAWVVSLDVADLALLAGTARGAWWRRPDGRARMLDALPSPYVQAVLLEGDRAWLGTDAGLHRWSEHSVDEILRPWAVYSLSHAPDGALWVGYEGWLRVDTEALSLGPAPRAERPGIDAPPPDVAAEVRGAMVELDFYELGLVDGELVGASPQGPVMVLESGALLADGPEGATGFAVDDDGGLWVAAGAQGLWTDKDRAGASRTWPWTGTEGTVWDVVALTDGGLGVATDRGLGLLTAPDADGQRSASLFRLSEWPADLPVEDGVFDGETLWIHGPEGVVGVGSERGQRPPGLPAVDLGGWRVEDGMPVRELEAGSVRIFQAHPVLSAALVDQGLCLGTLAGLEWLLEGEEIVVVEVEGAAADGVAVPAVASDGAGGCWFAASDGSVGRVDSDGRIDRREVPIQEAPNTVLPDGPDAAWVFTDVGSWWVRL